ncbi:hypothetical protein GF367_00610 [Candidatus Woesearchaeota archaeon]|nr:hypothetical protein [Candidatus Woesearchaeota archaeon]
MKKTYALLVMALMAMSLVPGATAVNTDNALVSTNAADASNTTVTSGDDDTPAPVLTNNGDSTFYDACVSRVHQEFPAADDDRAVRFCRKVAGTAAVARCKQYVREEFPHAAAGKPLAFCNAVMGLVVAADDTAEAVTAVSSTKTHYERCKEVLLDEFPGADEQRVHRFCGLKTMTRNTCVRHLRSEFPDKEDANIVRTCNQITTAVAAAAIESNVPSLTAEQRARLEKLEIAEVRKIVANHPKIARKIAAFTNAEVEKLGKLDRARLKVYAGKTPEEIKEALKKVHVTRVKKEEAFRKRVVSEERLRAAEKKYHNAVRHYNAAKDDFVEQKRAWEEAVEAGDEAAAIEHAKAYLGHAVDMVIESLEKVRAKIEANDDMAEEDVAEALADIDEKISTMASLQEELEAAETKEAVKAVGKKILAAWERTKHRLHVHAEKVVRSQVGEIMSRSEVLEQHLDRLLAKMEEGGIDVSDYDGKLELFSEKIADAREKFKASEDLFEQAKDEYDRDAFQRSKELAREAHDLLKEAHQILVELVRDVKQAGFDVDDDEEYVEVIEEDEDDEAVVCCMAMTAECLACVAGEDVEDYCADHPETAGCDEYVEGEEEGNDTGGNETA